MNDAIENADKVEAAKQAARQSLANQRRQQYQNRRPRPEGGYTPRNNAPKAETPAQPVVEENK